jgi:hypothetical protein
MASKTHSDTATLSSASLSLHIEHRAIAAHTDDVLVILLDTEALANLPSTLSASTQSAIKMSASRAGFTAPLSSRARWF